jgi:TonB family protein
MAGEARCCPSFYVTQTFRWTNGQFVLVGEQKRPWKGTQTQGSARGVQMQEQGGGDFAARYGWYAASIRHRIEERWLLNTIDPAARASHKLHATVAFTIYRDGTVKEIRITESSHNTSVDNSGLRAVLASNPMPTLPPDYKGAYVSVTFDFPQPGTH